MKITRKDLDKSQVEFHVELDAEDIKPHLSHAAQHISQHLKIAGFRPGKAPYEIVKREVGEAEIFKEALDDVINGSLIKVMQEQDVYPYGDPDLNVEKLTPLQEVVYTVKMFIYPKVKLGEWPTEKIKKNEIKATPEEIENSLKDLAKMLVREEVADRPAQQGDSAIIDFDVLVNRVPIEGGSAKDFNIVVGEGKMIPGFEDQIVGMKAGDVKDFKLNFPKDYKEDLAGKEADFKIAVKQVFNRTVPEIDDELAKKLGVESRAELNKRMEQNIVAEKNEKEMQKAEIEAVKKVVEVATISELPEKMV
ncbi:MAG TPA: trigger factor, partial [Candidatus Binatia bacterium]|nr:trigger factor [Candidatus Binatia bacterium]